MFRKTALGGATIAIAALISVGGALASPDAKGLNVTCLQNTNTTFGIATVDNTTFNFSADRKYWLCRDNELSLGRDSEGDGSGGSSGGEGGGSGGGTPQ